MENTQDKEYYLIIRRKRITKGVGISRINSAQRRATI